VVAADEASRAAAVVVEEVRRAPLDDRQVRALLRAVGATSPAMACDGFAAAQQAAWALDALAAALGEDDEGALRRAIGRLFPLLADPARYDADAIARAAAAVPIP
jgi:hypothetical protein